MWKRWRIWFGSALIVVLAGCMAAAQHREDMEKVHLVARTESIDQALVLLENYVLGKPGKDGERSIKTSADIIDLLEIGALYHYAGRYERSNEALEIVYAYYADEEMKAHISMSKIALGMLKSTLSEGLGGPYKLSGYEKVYLHTLKALNYLMLGDLEAARVEVRRGEHQHKLIEDKLAEDRAKEEESESSLTELLEGVSRLSSATDFQQNSGSEGESDQKNQDWSSPLATGALIGALPVVAVMGGVAAFQKNQEDAKNAKDAGEAKNTKNTQNTKEKVNLKQNESPLAAEVASREAFFKDAGLTAKERALIKKMKDGYRNAMTYNLSSVVYEANKESDDAMLDLYKSYGLHSNPAVGDRFVRLAVHKKRTRDKKIRNIYRLVRKQYPRVHRIARARPKQRSNVHVFLHTGDSPRIHALDIRIPNPISMTMSKISLPRYRPISDKNYTLKIRSGKRRGFAGEQLDFDKLALKSFNDKLQGIYFRGIMRLVLHTVADKKINEKMGAAMGQIVSSAKNEALEQADTRSWTSLPKIIRYASMLARGKKVEVVVRNQAGTRIFREKFPVEKGKITMVNVRKLGENFVARHTLVSTR